MEIEMSQTKVADAKIQQCKDCKYNINASQCTVYEDVKPKGVRWSSSLCEFYEKGRTLAPEDLEGSRYE
jgi:hypothetical protein